MVCISRLTMMKKYGDQQPFLIPGRSLTTALSYQLLSLSILLALAACYLAVRRPFLHQPLVGEEGIFANLFVNRPAGPDYLMFGRIEGQPRYIRMDHPAPLYETIRAAGWLGRRFVPDPPLPDATVTWRLRLAFSGFQLAVWGVLALLLMRLPPRPSRLAYAVLLAVVASPLAIKTSVDLQTDGSVGAWMTGLVAVAMAWSAGESRRPGLARSALFLTAMNLGCGKQEWSFVMLVALALTGGWAIWSRRQSHGALDLPVADLGVIASGLVLGNGISWFSDPINYRGGLSVMRRISASHALGTMRWHEWVAANGPRLGHLTTLLLLLAIVSVLLWGRRRALHPLHLVSALFGGGLFVGFLASGWNSDLRYFATAMMVLAVLAVCLCATTPGGWPRLAAVALAGVLLLHDASFLCAASTQPPMPAASLPSIPVGAVAFLETADGWNKPWIDFICRSMGWSGAQDTARRYGKVLWNPATTAP